MNKIPGYKSINEFARILKLSQTTVHRHMSQGYCDWPKRQKRNLAKHYLYFVWNSMVDRCHSKTSYKYGSYGARGISVYPLWRVNSVEFIAFIEEVLGPRPGLHYSLDRIDNDGNYEPGNLRWATPTEQANNKRRQDV